MGSGGLRALKTYLATQIYFPEAEISYGCDGVKGKRKEMLD